MSPPVPLPGFGSARTAEPPYDEERDSHPSTYGSLALDPARRSDHAARTPVTPLSVVREPDSVRSGPVHPMTPTSPDASAGPVAARGWLPDEPRLRALGQALAEILSGRRPPRTVQGRLSPRAYQELVRAGKMIDAECPPQVAAPHVQHPRDGVVEMCLLVRCGHRRRVIAARLERFGVQWLVTEFETA